MSEVQHSTMADTRPNDDRPGGTWVVTCTCGWKDEGNYARTNEIAESVALRLANAFGAQHEDVMAALPAGEDDHGDGQAD
jgi:hypothetical protein